MGVFDNKMLEDKIEYYNKTKEKLNNTPAQMNLQKAYNNFFSNPKKFGLPKTGLVKIKQHRNIPDYYKIKSVTISQNSGGKYFASVFFLSMKKKSL